ncbi:hypothetical protein BGY98DRAFT_1174821 [Russula aff. rugulosa BPL654]|nr:hypothetical protein BGY98DRAFT_1174821 [Russula aff. rugulosa BPL654]
MSPFVVIRKLVVLFGPRDNALAAILTFYESNDYLSHEMALEPVRMMDEQLGNLRKYYTDTDINPSWNRSMNKRLPGVAFDEPVGSKPIGKVFDFVGQPWENINTLNNTFGVSGGGALGFTRESWSTITSRPRDFLFTYYTGALTVQGIAWDSANHYLDIVCDSDIAVASSRGIFLNFRYIHGGALELKLLGKMVEGQADHYSDVCDDALKELLAVTGIIEGRCAARPFPTVIC